MPIVIVRQIVGARFDRRDFGNAIDMRINGMNVKLAEACGEIALRCRVQLLAFKEKHMPLGHRGS